MSENSKKHYIPMNSMKSPRFTGVRSFMRLPILNTLEDVDVAVVGIPTDSAVSFRSGARFGPEAIRSASILLRDYNPALGVSIPEELSMVDYGDAPVVPGYHEETLKRVQEYLEPIYAANVVPLILGGDHSLSIAELRALAKIKGPVSLIHIDAHGDVLDNYYGVKHFHGTVFRRAVEEGLVNASESVQIGMRGSVHPDDVGAAESLGYTVVPWDQLHQIPLEQLAELVKEKVKDRPVMLSFDIDFIDPAYAPGTGTPEVGGPSSYEAIRLLRALAPLNLNYCSFDCVEVSPPYDPAGVTSMAASVICFELLSLLAMSRRSKKSKSQNGHLSGLVGQ
ncbi:agmatinase [Leptospira perolatii]|uniref:Agmatinase n=1 Tax=Leptospira perolatii TaxID=2023191 RepID=A0A2M9ZQL3_9LEPT|nr:agmatinase [Leptospira perolatii]PJZ70479.1 agmatinase [Leptospira perolatii]PJZ74315.1 agmatinase [Leptospira perolatii]